MMEFLVCVATEEDPEVDGKMISTLKLNRLWSIQSL